MEMEPWLQTLLTILGTILASSGFWAYIQERSKRKAAENKQNNLETQMLIGLAHDRIIYLGMVYIERGYITQDEYENLYEYLYKPYEKLGGNGSAKRSMTEVDQLAIHKSTYNARIGGEVMSYSVSGTMITLTRGDTFSALITITDLNDNQYIPMNGDRIRFAMKNDYNDETPLLIKEIPIDTMILTLNPEDTKHLPFGKYVYDIELTKATGEVDTFITKAILKLTEEVH